MARESSVLAFVVTFFLWLWAFDAISAPVNLDLRVGVNALDNDVGFTGSKINERDDYGWMALEASTLISERTRCRIGVYGAESFGGERYNPSKVYADCAVRLK